MSAGEKAHYNPTRGVDLSCYNETIEMERPREERKRLSFSVKRGLSGMNHWLLLADPKAYGYGQLEIDRRTAWDGIRGSLAQKHLRDFRKGDGVLIYHTAPDKAIVGTARVMSKPYDDPKSESPGRVVVDLAPGMRFPHTVPLAALRANPRLSEMAFLKIQRIAVSPLTRAQYNAIMEMGRR